MGNTKIHDSVEALLQDLSPRTGRSILYELTDDELSQLLQHIQTALQKSLLLLKEIDGQFGAP